jgi:hypothetical protein
LNSLSAQQSAPPDWQTWSFLMGNWIGAGNGQPGQGSGGFTFKPDLQQRVLLRTNYAEYPATKDRPAYRHDDLMVIYHETPASPNEAIYFDSEGHVIQYAVQIDASAKTAIFLSRSEAGSPRYRLTYLSKAPDAVTIKFEVASPDKPDQFQTYIEATAKRPSK